MIKESHPTQKPCPPPPHTRNPNKYPFRVTIWIYLIFCWEKNLGKANLDKYLWLNTKKQVLSAPSKEYLEAISTKK